MKNHGFSWKLAGAVGLGGFAACATAPRKPPVAAKHPKKLVKHGDARVDPYYWLREREDKKVRDHLKAENAYTEAVLKPSNKLQKKLFKELKARIKDDDASVPYLRDGFYYYHRFAKGKEYPIYARRKGSLKAPEEVILDVNALAKGHPFCSVAAVKASPDHNLLAYAVDTVGRRRYTIRFKDLRNGKTLPDAIAENDGSMAWAGDNKTLYFVLQDTNTLRSDRVLRHTLGRRKSELVYSETDETFSVSVGKTLSRAHILIGSYSTLSTEFRVAPAGDPKAPFKVFLPRRRKHEYFLDHGGDRWFILSNDKARNFKLMETPENDRQESSWKEVIGHRDAVLIEDVDAFKSFLAVTEREGGLTRIRIMDRATGDSRFVGFNDPAYSAGVGVNAEYDAKTLRYDYESLTTPESVYDYDLETGKSVLKKEKEIPGGFNRTDYKSERLTATARDGSAVPVSLVYRKGKRKKGGNPVLLLGYGSYGISYDADFYRNAISLLDRGFIYAIAHVRGGSDMGRKWYEDGRQLKKMNTFTDFIDCAEHLVQAGYAKRDGLHAWGGSAGGLLMGAVANMRPDLWRSVLADVPFVDVMTTMLDPDIPLTTGEYDEWGNPNDKAFYDYMKSYSPYDNVEAKAYPNMLITTGLHDSQVQYWEPAKWVAKLRDLKTDDNLLLLRTDMSVGHGGASGRFETLKLEALQFAWMLTLEGITE